MKIELEEREIDTLPNDMELGKYVRFKLHEAKKANAVNVAGTVRAWTTTATANVSIEWDLNSNKI
jgi:hypothetical protein